MNRVLNDLKGYKLRKTENYNLKRGNVTRDLRASDGPMDITKEFSELVEKLDKISILPAMGGYMGKITTFARSLKLVDDTAKLLYANDNLRRMGNIDKTLKQETEELKKPQELKKTQYYKKIVDLKETGIQALEAKFLMKYENMKQELKKNKEAIKQQSELITKLKTTKKEMDNKLQELKEDAISNAFKIPRLKEKITKIEQEIFDAKVMKLKLTSRRASLMNLSEKNVVDMAKDINKSNRNEVALNLIGSLACIAADVILAISLPVSKVILVSLQIPVVFGKLIKAIDIHIFKKLREKSEASRKEEMMRAEIKNLNKAIGTDKFNEIVANEKDMAKQLEKIEKTEDTEIKSAFETSRRSQDVLCAKPKWNLRMFKIEASEDNDRLENTAKFVLKHIKELPDDAKIKEELEKDDLDEKTKNKLLKGLKQVEESKERVKTMLEVLGIDNADDYIRDVKEYKSNKEEDLKALDVSKFDKSGYTDKKNKLKERLVEAMKQKL